MQTLDLNTLIGEVISNFQSHLAANALTLHRNLALEPLPVSGSSNRLYAVLRELMDNAIRFTPPGGSIYLRSICQDQTIVVEIQDTGPGIPNESLPHIFKHFYRQDRAHTTPGLGLGLSIVKSIVEGHGGQIEVESQPGSGSLFRILLPLAKVMSNE
jgi:signal transduction histidine kinase